MMSMKRLCGRDERAKIAASLVEPQGERAAGRDQYIAEMGFAGRAVPGKIRIQEDESEVVHVAVVLLWLEEARIVLGMPPPLLVERALCQ